MKRVGIRDVAERAGASISTVSNALNRPGSVSEPLAARVRAAADALGYVPLHAARQLRAGRSGLLGMTVINIANPFFGALVSGAEEAVAAAGYGVLVGNSEDDAARERGHLELFERVQVEGVLLSPFGDAAESIARLRARRHPRGAGRLRGRRGSAAVGVVRRRRGRAPRRRAPALDRSAQAGVPRRARRGAPGARAPAGCAARRGRPSRRVAHVVWSARTTADLGKALGAEIAAAPPELRPDGIITTNDHLACGVVFGLISNGVRVPDEIAVIGYDDIEFASVAAVPLTSVRQPAREMGRHAGDLLLHQIDGEATEPLGSVMFEPELVVRASSVRGA